MAKKTTTGGSGGTGGDAPTREVERGSEAASDAGIARLGYEDAVRELEALVESIEQGEVSLEASLQAYRRGEQLVRHCRRLLDAAEATVRETNVGELEQGG